MIYIDKTCNETLYMQIYRQVKNDILQGIIKEGDVLQGSRGLARTLHVSRNTVDNAYSQLLAEGYIIPKRGIGYVVACLPELKIPSRRKTLEEVKKQEDSLQTEENQNILYDLTNGSHTNDLFPKTLWKKATLECLGKLDIEKKLATTIDKQGEQYLRCTLLSYLKRIRGIHCAENQIIITCGIQQSLEYICKLLSNGENTVLMEEPGYHKATAVFQNNSLNIQKIPIDESGLIVSMLPAHKENSIIYSTPSHQFPTGVTMPINRRLELLSWAKNNNAYIIEDDFDSELRYYAKPIPSLQSIDVDDRVIYLGTFSKALSPTIRMGYMILPPKLISCYLSCFQDYNSTVPVLNQYVVARMIETGEYDRHVRRMNHIFRKRLECFEKEFANISNNLKLSGNGSGQYFLLELSSKTSQDILIERALRHGVKVYSTMQFWQEKTDCPPNTLFLGFSKIDIDDIHDCVLRLKEAWSEWL